METPFSAVSRPNFSLSPEVVDYFKRLDNEVGGIAATNYSNCGECFGVILARIACEDIGLIKR
jgi:hypothetical protein